MSKTGAGPGGHQYGPHGPGKTPPANQHNEPASTDLHTTQFGQTSIDLDAAAFLTPEYAHITTLDAMNEAEALNIFDARDWLNKQVLEPDDILNQSFMLDLHRRMFCDVWTWAGRIRERETNMGIDPMQIRERWQSLLGDVRFWIENETYPTDEIGIRMHHQSVQIHPFTNGNGRHARISANKLAQALGLGAEIFTWGRISGRDVETSRISYLDALREADNGNYSALLAIATS